MVTGTKDAFEVLSVPRAFGVVPRIQADSGRGLVDVDGNSGRVDCGCGHVFGVGSPRYMPAVVLLSLCVAYFKNSSIARGAGRVGLQRSPDVVWS